MTKTKRPESSTETYFKTILNLHSGHVVLVIHAKLTVNLGARSSGKFQFVRGHMNISVLFIEVYIYNYIKSYIISPPGIERCWDQSS